MQRFAMMPIYVPVRRTYPPDVQVSTLAAQLLCPRLVFHVKHPAFHPPQVRQACLKLTPQGLDPSHVFYLPYRNARPFKKFTTHD